MLVRSLESLVAGDHIGVFPGDALSCSRDVAAFFRQGLVHGGPCIAVSGVIEVGDIIRHAQPLEMKGQDSQGESGITVTDAARFDGVDGLLKFLDEQERTAVSSGRSTLRVAMDLCAAAAAFRAPMDVQSLQEKLVAWLKGRSCIMLFIYDMSKGPGFDTGKGLDAHPLLMVDEVLIINPYHLPGGDPSDGSPDARFQARLSILARHAALQKAMDDLQGRFRFVFENSSDILFFHDLMGNITDINLSSDRLETGPARDLVGMNLKQVIPEGYTSDLEKYLLEVGTTGKAHGIIRTLMPSGQDRYLSYMSERIRGRTGEVLVRGLATDITERTLSEKALEKSEDRIRDIFDNVSDYLFFHDLDGNFDFSECNVKVKEDWVSLEDTKTNANLKDIIPDRYKDLFRTYIERVCATSRDEGFVMVVPKDGREHVLEYKSSLVCQDGVPVGVRGSARDITDRLRAEKNLKKSEEKYRTILDSIEEGYYEADIKGFFTFVNHSMCMILGYPRDEILGQSYRAFVEPDTGQRIRTVFSTVYRTGNPDKGFDWEIVRKDGQHKPIESSISLMRDSAGQPLGFRGMLRDITHRKQAEELQKAVERVEAQNRSKSEFLAHMSHEIRTPINGVIGMTEIALDTSLTDEQREILGTIYRESENLLALVSDILDFSKLESERLQMEEIPFDLKVLMEDLVRGFAVRAEQKGLELILYISPEIRTRLVGDPGRLRQILVNLISNALKFTMEGEILIKVEHLAGLGDKARLRFLVIDTGIGIPEDKHALIFESFTQADSSTTRKYGGTGLGLSICKKLAGLMGGEIGLMGDQDRGSTFWFTAEFALQTAQAALAESREMETEGLNVLVVDDNASSRSALASYLAAWRCRIQEATSGRQALETLEERIHSGLMTDLIITDSHMPGMDGFELASRIRADEGMQDIPIILVTPVGNIGDGMRCRQQGIQGYLPKPVRSLELQNMIQAVMHREEVMPETPSDRLVTRHSLAEQRGSGGHILLAEDYPTNQQVACRHLTDAGYTVDVVEDGLKAVAAFKRASYDLIIMDIEMPNMDGFTAAKTIRQIEDRIGNEGEEKSTKRTPIIAMTAHAIHGFRERSLNEGMDDFITKPVKRKDLIGAVQKWISPPPVPDAAMPRAREERAEAPEGQGGAPMDLKRALEEFDGDREFIMELLGGFLTAVRAQLPTIRKAASEGDAERLKKEAHSIKGGAANLTAQDLSGCALELERMAKGGDLDGAAAIIARLEKEFSRLEEYAESI